MWLIIKEYVYDLDYKGVCIGRFRAVRGPGKAAEWKNCSEEELLVLRRLVGEKEVTVVEEKRRFQVQVGLSGAV